MFSSEQVPDKPQGMTDNLSVLDLLTDNEIEEVQSIAENSDESFSVSQRLSEMVAEKTASNPEIQAAMRNAQVSAAEKFAKLLATPLHELSKEIELDIECEIV